MVWCSVCAVAVCVSLSQSVSGQTTWYVDDDACPAVGAGTEADPFCRIQSGIEIADSLLDKVLVHEGVYNEAVDFLGKKVEVRSVGGPEVTIIDATGFDSSAVTFTSRVGYRTVLSGFTVTGGRGNLVSLGRYSVLAGGGIFIVDSYPSIEDCVIQGNRAAFGGGMYIGPGASPRVTGCTFTENEADTGGGLASYYSGGQVSDCTFMSNEAHHGGGMWTQSSGIGLSNSSFVTNRAYEEGGGVWNYEGHPGFSDCSFIGNESSFTGGGGMFNEISHCSIHRCLFHANRDLYGYGGGALANWQGIVEVANSMFLANSAGIGGGGAISTQEATNSIVNSLFVGNVAEEGGSVLGGAGSHSSLIGCSLVGNPPTRGSTFNLRDDIVMIANSIIRSTVPGASPTTAGLIAQEFSLVTFVASNIEGGVPPDTIDGGGNISTDPSFVRWPNGGDDRFGDDPFTPDVDEGANDDFGDLRLQADSPCIDAGRAVPGYLWPDRDLDGRARTLCAQADMGAYEFGQLDATCDRVVDLADFAVWTACAFGPYRQYSDQRCRTFDLNLDRKIDLRELAGVIDEFGD